MAKIRNKCFQHAQVIQSMKNEYICGARTGAGHIVSNASIIIYILHICRQFSLCSVFIQHPANVHTMIIAQLGDSAFNEVRASARAYSRKSK